MYAVVAAGSQGVLLSNDEMRDHIFQLLAPKFFYKWKQVQHSPLKHSLLQLVLHCFKDTLDSSVVRSYRMACFKEP